MLLGKLDNHMQKIKKLKNEKELHPYLIPLRKIHSEWIKGLITIKLLGKKQNKTGRKVLNIGFGSDYFG